MTPSHITYEQPLNENIRLCLRLEHLFKQLDRQLHQGKDHDSRVALETLLRIVDVTDLASLKSKLLQTLAQHTSTLAQLEQFPQVDKQRLQQVIHQLDCLMDALHHYGHNKIAESLRLNPFLRSVRSQLNSLSGACDFNVPAYALWLSQDCCKRLVHLENWAKELSLLRDCTQMILKLTRESTPAQTVSTEDAFYQQALDPNLPCQMVRITVPTAFGVYPEISVGKHRLSIRFRKLVTKLVQPETAQLKQTFAFKLSCCRA